MRVIAHDVGGARQALGVWNIGGEGVLMIDSTIVILKRGNHRKDRFALLVSLHPTSAERPAIAKAVDRKGDWQVDVTRAQKVSVKRMWGTSGIHRASGGHQTLCQNLATENSTVGHPLTWARENVFTSSCPTGIG
jgi:hypothetical protein